VEAASGGTLFLDEIGEMPLAMQAKVLRFLENRRFMRVGGSTKIDADVRLVCATLRPLEEEVRVGRFRADLYYRVQGITLNVPPLRDRKGDIPQLIDQFLMQLSARHATQLPRLSRSARSALMAYAWPGNVRELKNVLEMLCLLRPGKSARLADLPQALQQPLADAADPLRDTLTLDLKETLDSMIERVLDAVLIAEGGNRTRAARRLGISLRTLQRRASTTPRRAGRGSARSARSNS
jgi:transcriptional regulator with PAS, ATPase and Fis domain